MDFRVLGPVEAVVRGHALPLGSGKQRALLAALLLHPNRVVSIERLVELMWNDESPDTARNVLQVYVSQLRKLLEPQRERREPPQVLIGGIGGYTLRLDPESIDLTRFERLALAGRHAFAAGEARDAARLLGDALAVWRGPAFADVDASFAVAERTRLEERRLTVLEDRIDADLSLEGDAKVVAEVQALVALHPLRERLWGQLMLALYRGGRQADASQTYHKLRELLANEHGIEPSLPLQKLFEQILNQDPALDALPRTGSPPGNENAWFDRTSIRRLSTEFATVSATVEATSNNRSISGRELGPPAGGFLGALPERPLVGRAAELGQVLTAVELAAAGKGQLVLLVGEPGIGKTRLAQELALRAEERGFRVLVGRCYPQRASAPLFPFVEVLEAGVALIGHEALNMLAARWPDLGRVVASLGTQQSHGDNSEILERVLAAVTAFLRLLAAEAPLALLLDDLHWADSASLELLQHLVRHLHGDRVLVLATYRNADVGPRHPLEAAVADLTREHLVLEVQLGGMAPQESAELVQSCLDTPQPPRELLELVHARTEGNPFFIEELLKAMIEQGFIGKEAGDWMRADASKIRLPHSIRSVIGQRLARLEAGVQDMMHVASVLGLEFDFELLVATSMQPEQVILDHLDTALSAHLIEERLGGVLDRFGFAHALIQQSLYDEQPVFRRRRIHLRAGEALERMQPLRMAAWDDFARHFLAAGEAPRSIHYSLLAGDQASALFAHVEAARHYQGALDLLLAEGNEEHAAEVRCKLASELNDLNRPDEAIAMYEAALATYKRRADSVLEARVHRALAWVHQIRFDLTRALPHLDAALRLWPSEREDAEFVLLLLDVSRAKLFAGDTAVAAGMAERGLDLASLIGDSALQGRALVEIAISQWHGAGQAAVIGLLDRAELLASGANDMYTLQRVYMNRSDRRYWAGDMVGFWTDSKRAVEIAEKTGAPGRIATAAWNYVGACYVRGMWRAGRETAQKHLPDRVPRHLSQLLLAVMEGTPEMAIPIFEAQYAEAASKRDWQTQIMLLCDLALIALDLGRSDKAMAAARQVAVLDSSHAMAGWSTRAYGPLAEAAVRVGSGDAEVILNKADAVAVEYKLYAIRPQLQRARGLLLWQRGDLEAAISMLEASASLARSQASVLELARTLAVMADVARAQEKADLAASADNERALIIERIGAEARGLIWASMPHPVGGA